MTTIAYKDGILACDSQITENDIVMHRTNKIIKLAPKNYITFCGNMTACLRFIDQIKNHKNIADCSLPENSYIIHAKDGELYYIDNNMFPDKIANNKPYSNGSGNHIAMGAMMAGASAVEAVRIACQLDINSSAPIYSVNINE